MEICVAIYFNVFCPTRSLSSSSSPLASFDSSSGLKSSISTYKKHVTFGQMINDSDIVWAAVSVARQTSSIAASWSRDLTSKRTIWRGEGSQLLDICVWKKVNLEAYAINKDWTTADINTVFYWLLILKEISHGISGHIMKRRVILAQIIIENLFICLLPQRITNPFPNYATTMLLWGLTQTSEYKRPSWTYDVDLGFVLNLEAMPLSHTFVSLCGFSFTWFVL